jgi:hypothetical protein
MIHIFCADCDGWDSFPSGGSHNCETVEVITNPSAGFIGGDCWFGDDSDY